jgi:transglutaminase-like putative cysteine protease
MASPAGPTVNLHHERFAATARELLARDGRSPLEALFAFVQALPYRWPGPRDALHCLENGWGTCSGKNMLLYELLRAAGIPCAHTLIVGDLTVNPPAVPATLRTILGEGPLPDVHAALTALGPTGPVTVDASWDLPLAALGFPVARNWDGSIDTPLAITPSAVYAVCGHDPVLEKELLRGRVFGGQPELLARRDRYLHLLSTWIAEERAKGTGTKDSQSPP